MTAFEDEELVEEDDEIPLAPGMPAAGAAATGAAGAGIGLALSSMLLGITGLFKRKKNKQIVIVMYYDKEPGFSRNFSILINALDNSAQTSQKPYRTNM